MWTGSAASVRPRGPRRKEAPPLGRTPDTNETEARRKGRREGAQRRAGAKHGKSASQVAKAPVSTSAGLGVSATFEYIRSSPEAKSLLVTSQ